MRIKVSDYLVKKLAEFGIEEVFGLPGDYNFDIVEAIEKSEKINWIGSTNELNATGSKIDVITPITTSAIMISARVKAKVKDFCFINSFLFLKHAHFLRKKWFLFLIFIIYELFSFFINYMI